MIVDVNVLLADFYPEHPHHRDAAGALTGEHPIEVTETVLVGFMRLATTSRLWRRPAPAGLVREYADRAELRHVAPDARARTRFLRLCEDLHLSGNDVPDAWLAALAIERAVPLLSFDRGFARFEELDWRRA